MLDGKEYEYSKAIRNKNGEYIRCSACALLSDDKSSCPVMMDNVLYYEFQKIKNDERRCTSGFFKIKKRNRLKLKL